MSIHGFFLMLQGKNSITVGFIVRIQGPAPSIVPSFRVQSCSLALSFHPFNLDLALENYHVTFFSPHQNISGEDPSKETKSTASASAPT